MLEGALEQLLLQFLAPYVDGISRDKLHLGVFSGSLELKDLTVKTDALALLGLRVRLGKINLIKIAVPWSQLYSGKVSMSIETLQLQVEFIGDSSELSKEQIVKKLQEAKQTAINDRVQQLEHLLQQNVTEEDGGKNRENMRLGAKLVRKVLNNISIDLTGVEMSFVNHSRGLAYGLEFPQLAMISTDESFRIPTEEVVMAPRTSLYKLLLIRDLGVRMAPAGTPTLEGADHVISPITASLQLTHVPSDNTIHLKLEVATRELAEVVLRRSQIKHLFRVMHDINTEAAEIRALLVSPEEERTICMSIEVSKTEYGRLFERRLLEGFEGASAEKVHLNEGEERRLQLLEDALSVRLLARERWRVKRKIEALNVEAERLACVKERKTSTGFFGRFRRRAPSEEGQTWISSEQKAQLLKDIDDESKVESVDLPTRFGFEFVLGQAALDLVDDRHSDEVHRQLLSLSMETAHLSISVDCATDHRGQDSAEWCLEICLSSFHALQFNQDLCLFAQKGKVQKIQGAPEAAKLKIESKLEKDCNLLRLCFEFAPLEVNMLPGAYEETMQFFRTPEDVVSIESVKLPGADDGELHLEDYVDISKQWLENHPGRAEEVVTQVYERIPDKMDLHLSIASPIFHVPVTGMGKATFSFGQLSVVTPEPCEFGMFDFKIDLNHSALTAVSTHGERFDMIQPVPVHLTIAYRSSEEKGNLNIQMDVKEMAISLAPQALQILLSTPFSIANIMYEQERQTDQHKKEQNVESALARPSIPTATGTLSSTNPDLPDTESVPLTRRASILASQVLGKKGTAALEEAKRRVEQVRSRNFVVNLAMQFDALDITLADSIIPVMRFRFELAPPGLVMYRQSIPNLLTMNVIDGNLEVEMLNPRNGVWEPLAERFSACMEMERKAVSDEDKSTHVVLSGKTPLLVNLTPTAVQRASWIIPEFIESLSFEPREFFSTPSMDKQAEDIVKYKVVNLCDDALELLFKSKHRSNLRTVINPTGDDWKSIDEWVLPYFTTSLMVQFPGSNRPSQSLHLERLGTVRIPGSDYVAELLASGPSQRIVLLATPLRIHNQTDFTLSFHFHDCERHDVLPMEYHQTATCDAALCGKMQSQDMHCSEQVSAIATPQQPDTQCQDALLVKPNSVCAVPLCALVGGHTWVSMRPLGIQVHFCPAFELGTSSCPSSVCCASRDDPYLGSVYLACVSTDVRWSTHGHIALTTVVVQPTLVLLNAIPIGNVSVKYSWHASGRKSQSTTRSLPSFKRLNIYNIPSQPSDQINISMQLYRDAPWTKNISISRDDYKDPDNGTSVRIRQLPHAAAADVLVEMVNHIEMRLSCPNWFNNRCGLDVRRYSLQLSRNGQVLPNGGPESGIFLLPSDCTQEDFEIELLRTHQDATTTGIKSLRMPPSWTAFPLSVRTGRPLVLCLQVDDIATSDVFGAQCQIATLRPRLILTNASTIDIELCLSNDRVMKLTAGESFPHHWHVQNDDDPAPSTTIKFRTAGSSIWSGRVECSDAAAGSTPFAVRGPHGAPAVWSVDVAPDRGALAVSFRQGSDYIAVNRTMVARISMSIHPVGDSESSRLHVPLGQEVPYGWTDPFSNAQRGLEVIIRGNRYPVGDVRRTQRKVFRDQKVALVVAQVGSRALLSLEDYDGSSSTQVSRQGSWLQLSVKISCVGISLVEESPDPRELLFLNLQLIRLVWQRNSSEVQLLKLAVSEAQIDCQLPGRIDANNRQKGNVVLLQHERPAAIFANWADGDRAFLEITLQRAATSSKDILIPSAEIALDMIDLSLDDDWLDPLVMWLRKARSTDGTAGLLCDKVFKTAGRSILDGYVLPPVPSVVQVDSTKISALNCTVWCSLKLKTVRFLPQWVRTAIRLLSLSGNLTLDGGTLSLPAREVPPHRGSLVDFLHNLAGEYTVNLLKDAAGILGRSSVLNVPRIPIKMGGGTVGYIAEGFGLFAAEGAQLLNRLTFDDEYVERQHRIRNEKRILGIQDGFVEAGRSLVQGVEGFFDVVTKPKEGYQAGGVGGFFEGLGKGVAGSVVKPFTKLGQAFSDIGSGIAAQVGDAATVRRRHARIRQRQPRMLFGELGAIRPFSVVQAEVLRQLTPIRCCGVEEIVPLRQRGSETMQMLLFPQHSIIVKVKIEMPDGEHSSSTALNGGSSGSSSSSSSGWQKGRGTKNTAHSQRTLPEKKQPDSSKLDFTDAVEESATKVFEHALKPIHLMLSNFQEKGKSDEVSDSSGAALGREIRFRHLRDVHLMEGNVIQLEEKQGVLNIPLNDSPLGVEAKQALVEGMRSAIFQGDGNASWYELTATLLAERRCVPVKSSWKRAPAIRGSGEGSGECTLEVFEVERRMVPAGDWKTPFLPTDTEASWRWLDATGCRHPRLRKGMTREECAKRGEPPCEMDSLFKPTSAWKFERNDCTDEKGWKYSIAWKSSTWDSSPGVFDAFRKRRWTRTYA